MVETILSMDSTKDKDCPWLINYTAVINLGNMGQTSLWNENNLSKRFKYSMF